MRKAVAGAAALVVAGLVALPGTAEADTKWPHVRAAYFAPKERVVYDVEGRVGKKWQLRKTVENFDRRMPMLNMLVGECEDYPKAGCVHVSEVNRPHADFWGRFKWQGTWRTNWIKLNAGYGRDRHVSCHEVAHSLGEDHHRKGPGCLKIGDFDAVVASEMEMRELRTAYRQMRGY